MREGYAAVFDVGSTPYQFSFASFLPQSPGLVMAVRLLNLYYGRDELISNKGIAHA